MCSHHDHFEKANRCHLPTAILPQVGKLLLVSVAEVFPLHPPYRSKTVGNLSAMYSHQLTVFSGLWCRIMVDMSSCVYQ